MLILKSRAGEQIRIGDAVIRIEQHNVRVCIDAPLDISITREPIHEGETTTTQTDDDGQQHHDRGPRIGRNRMGGLVTGNVEGSDPTDCNGGVLPIA